MESSPFVDAIAAITDCDDASVIVEFPDKAVEIRVVDDEIVSARSMFSADFGSHVSWLHDYDPKAAEMSRLLAQTKDDLSVFVEENPDFAAAVATHGQHVTEHELLEASIKSRADRNVGVCDWLKVVVETDPNAIVYTTIPTNSLGGYLDGIASMLRFDKLEECLSNPTSWALGIVEGQESTLLMPAETPEENLVLYCAQHRSLFGTFWNLSEGFDIVDMDAALTGLLDAGVVEIKKSELGLTEDPYAVMEHILASEEDENWDDDEFDSERMHHYMEMEKILSSTAVVYRSRVAYMTELLNRCEKRLAQFRDTTSSTEADDLALHEEERLFAQLWTTLSRMEDTLCEVQTRHRIVLMELMSALPCDECNEDVAEVTEWIYDMVKKSDASMEGLMTRMSPLDTQSYESAMSELLNLNSESDDTEDDNDELWVVEFDIEDELPDVEQISNPATNDATSAPDTSEQRIDEGCMPCPTPMKRAMYAVLKQRLDKRMVIVGAVAALTGVLLVLKKVGNG